MNARHVIEVPFDESPHTFRGIKWLCSGLVTLGIGDARDFHYKNIDLLLTCPYSDSVKWYIEQGVPTVVEHYPHRLKEYGAPGWVSEWKAFCKDSHKHLVRAWNVPKKDGIFLENLEEIPPGWWPDKFVEVFLDAFVPKGGVLLDHHMGSGRQALVCLRKGRRFIGIDSKGPRVEDALELVDSSGLLSCIP